MSMVVIGSERTEIEVGIDKTETDTNQPLKSNPARPKPKTRTVTIKSTERTSPATRTNLI